MGKWERAGDLGRQAHPAAGAIAKLAVRRSSVQCRRARTGWSPLEPLHLSLATSDHLHGSVCTTASQTLHTFPAGAKLTVRKLHSPIVARRKLCKAPNY